MAVAESTVPGRWSIVEVVPDGPAATVGIRPGDDLRAINGLAMASADDVSQALTAIAAGQTVRLSVARADQVSRIDAQHRAAGGGDVVQQSRRREAQCDIRHHAGQPLGVGDDDGCGGSG